MYLGKFIKEVSGRVVTTNKEVEINVDSKNLIIIGRNGSGKTSFLTSLYEVLKKNIVEGQILTLHKTIATLADFEAQLAANPDMLTTVEHYRNLVKSNTYPLKVEYSDVQEFIKGFKERYSVVRFYEATRKIAIGKVSSATPLKVDVPPNRGQSNLGVDLEQHLVNLQVSMGLAMRRGDDQKIGRIEKWFEGFESDLKYLFEDESLELKFDDDRLSFSLAQSGRPDYTFQSLSSGYLAIFDIYADLVVRTEYFDVLPSEISGVVIIDEIDAHLHISIQRKILPFLSRSFPKIQFIVSTHSPFVVSSTEDSLIYDLSTGRICEDLSLFSLEHIVEAILGVPPVSQRMQELIAELVSASSSSDTSLESMEKLLAELSPHVETFDDESRMFYEVSRSKYLLRKKGGGDV